MDDRISFSEMNYVSDYLRSEYDVDSASTLQHVYESYTVMPSSKLSKLSSYIHNNGLNYLGTFSHKHSVYDLYASESTYSLIHVTPDNLISGNIKPVDIDKDKLYNALGLRPVVEIEDITATTEAYLLYNDDTPQTPALEVQFGEASAATTGGGSEGNDTGGGDVEDITATTNDVLKDSGDDISGTGNDLAGDDFGGMDGDLDGEGGGDDQNGNSPDMLDEENNDDEPDDEGTAAKKRIRKNMYKLHTIIRDNLDAMKSFTPAYEVDNSRKYYRIQSILNIEDEIILRIIRDEINKLTVEDLMKKYTTLCQILDIAIRYMHEFKTEYKAISDKYQKRGRRTVETEGKEGDKQLQQ